MAGRVAEDSTAVHIESAAPYEDAGALVPIDRALRKTALTDTARDVAARERIGAADVINVHSLATVHVEIVGGVAAIIQIQRAAVYGDNARVIRRLDAVTVQTDADAARGHRPSAAERHVRGQVITARRSGKARRTRPRREGDVIVGVRLRLRIRLRGRDHKRE